MLFRNAHFWLCCLNLNADDVFSDFQGNYTRIEFAPEPKSKFGPYDYIFISVNENTHLNLMLEQLLERLEPYKKSIAKWGDSFTCGIQVKVSTSEFVYAEEIDSAVFERIAKLNLRVTFGFEYIPLESEANL